MFTGIAFVTATNITMLSLLASLALVIRARRVMFAWINVTWNSFRLCLMTEHVLFKLAKLLVCSNENITNTSLIKIVVPQVPSKAVCLTPESWIERVEIGGL